MSAIAHTTSHPATRAALNESAADLLGHALTLQGADALACTRQHAAFHEAGHAVMSSASGLRVYSVAVFRRGSDWLGWTNSGTAWKVGPDPDPLDDLRQARVLMAGPMSEQAFTKKPALGAGLDEIALAKTIIGSTSHKLGIAPDALMMRTMEETLETHRQTLDALAGALMRKPKLKQIELARLLRRVVTQ